MRARHFPLYFTFFASLFAISIAHTQSGVQNSINPNGPNSTGVGMSSSGKSVNMGGTPFSVTFLNQTGSNVDAYWVDFQGINQRIGTLFPNQAAQVTTYPGHLTVFAANGQQVAKFQAGYSTPSAAFSIVGANSSASNSSVPVTSTSIPANFSNGNQNSAGNTSLAGLGNLIQSLTKNSPAIPTGGLTTSNQFPASTPVQNTLSSLIKGLSNFGKSNNSNPSGNSGIAPNPAPNPISSQTGAPQTPITGTGSNVTPQDAQALVDFHNRVRAEVGLGPVTWDPEVAAFAQKYADIQAADTSKWDHNPNRTLGSITLGENLAMGTGYTPLQLADQWYTSEKNLWTRGSVISNGSNPAGHYTQMIWKTSTKIGAGIASSGQSLYLVCNYSPGGNQIGQDPEKAVEKGNP